MQGMDLNHRPPGYEPDELPNCSTLNIRRQTLHRSASGFYYSDVVVLVASVIEEASIVVVSVVSTAEVASLTSRTAGGS